jgi:hypothetical protein
MRFLRRPHDRRQLALPDRRPVDADNFVLFRIFQNSLVDKFLYAQNLRENSERAPIVIL